MTKFKYYNLGICIGKIDFENFHSETIDSKTKLMEKYDDYSNDENLYSLPLDMMEKIYRYFRNKNFLVDNQCENLLIMDYTFEKLSSYEDKLFKLEDHIEIYVQRNRQFPVDIIVYRDSFIGFIFVDRENVHYIVRDQFQNSIPLSMWRDKSEDKICGIDESFTEMVRMKDGVHLASEILLPYERKKSCPIILVRTPYGRKSSIEKYKRYVHYGYGLVVQDVRGREDSEGIWIPKIHEMSDGSDTLDWINKQVWCDGNIGMIGGSYLGFVQWAAVASGNKHLKCVTSVVTSGSPFRDVPRKGGTMLFATLAWAFMMSESKKKEENMDRNDWESLLEIKPYSKIPEKALGHKLDYWENWIKHENYDEFWEQADWTRYPENFNVPAFIVSGLYDDNCGGTRDAINMKKSIDSNNYRLILGPWCHKANTTREINKIIYPSNSIRYDIDHQFLNWFELNLKNKRDALSNYPVVSTYTLGSGEWIESLKWPRENTKEFKMYLNKIEGKEVLDGKIGENGVSEYIYDPDDCPPFLLNLSDNECNVPGNYREVEERSDVVYFETEKLIEDVTIAGDIFTELYLQSNCPDTDWIVRLSDVDENGNSIRLSDGVIRAKYRNSFKVPELLEDKIYKYNIELTKIANKFKKGHRIRFSIMSAAKNLIFPNTNTGKDPMFDTMVKIANQKIYFGKDNPSCIILPVEVL